MISSIYTAQHNGFMSDIWKFASGIYFAFATSIYLTFIYLLLNNYIIKNKLNFLILQISSVKHYNSVLNITLYLITPIMLLHYYLFLSGDKYKALIKQYKKQYSKKMFAWYFMLSFLVLFICLFLNPNV